MTELICLFGIAHSLGNNNTLWGDTWCLVHPYFSMKCWGTPTCRYFSVKCWENSSLSSQTLSHPPRWERVWYSPFTLHSSTNGIGSNLIREVHLHWGRCQCATGFKSLHQYLSNSPNMCVATSQVCPTGLISLFDCVYTRSGIAPGQSRVCRPCLEWFGAVQFAFTLWDNSIRVEPFRPRALVLMGW